MTDITRDEMVAILEQKLAGWKQAYYSHEIDARIGKDLDDQQMIDAAKANMKRAQKVMDSIKAMKSELSKDS